MTMTAIPIDTQLKELQKNLAVRLAPLKVRVVRKADELHILIEYPSDQVPPRPQLVRQVASCLVTERPAELEKLILYGRQAGQSQAEWRKVLRFSGQGSAQDPPLAEQTELVMQEPPPAEMAPEPQPEREPPPTAPERSGQPLSERLNALWHQLPQTQVFKQRGVQLALGAVLVGSLVGLGSAYKISRDGELAERGYQQGLQQARAERWQQAIEQYEQGLRHRPRDPRLQAALLHAQNRLNQANERIQQAQTQLAADPSNTVARLNLATAFSQQGNLSAAASELSTLLSFDPNHAPARFLLAEIHLAQGSLPEAIEQYRAALAVDPQLPSAQRQLGMALLKQGQTEAALQALQTAVTQNPNDAEAHYQLGSAYAQQKNWDPALRHYLQAAQLDPAHVAAQERLGRWFLARGYTEAALSSLQAAVQADPQNPQLRLQLGMAQQAAGDLQSARSSYERALSLDANLTEARLNLAQLHLAQGNPEAAIPLFEQLLQVDPNAWEARLGLGIALAEQEGSLDNAIQHLQQASQQQPTHALTRRYLGLALEQAGRREEAIAQLQEAVRLDPNDAEAQRYLGLLLAQQGQTQAALAQLERSLDQDPTNPTALGSRAVLQVSVGGQAEREAQIAATLARQSTPNPSRLVAATENQATRQLRLQIPLSRLQPAQANPVPNTSEGQRPPTQGQPTAPQLAQVPPPPTAATSAATPTYSPSETLPLPGGWWAWITGGLLGIPSLLSLTWLAGRQLRRRNSGAGGGQTPKDQASRHYSRALSLIEGKQLSQAIGALQQALSINPDMAPAHFRLGQLLIQTGQLQSGLDHLWSARQLDPYQPDIDTHLVKALLSQSQQLLSKRQPGAALEPLKLALTLNIKSPGFQAHIHQLRGEALAAQGEGAAALEALNRARQLDPKRAEVLLSIAKVKILQKQYQSAIDSCWEALALNEGLPEAHHQMGIALYRLGQLKAAIAAYRTAQTLRTPATPALLTDYGLALVQAGDLAQAGQQFSQALVQEPGFAPAIYGTGIVLMAQSNFAEAEQRFHQALELDPELHVATAALGLLQLAQKQSDDSGKRFINSRQAEVALRYFESALRKDPDLPEAHFGLGELQRVKGNLIFAAQRYQEALELNNSYVAAHYRLGSVQARLGKLDLAIEEFRRALELNPHLPEAQKSLHKLLSRQPEDVHTDILMS
ncbi:tetratricopeptide repeat protein [Thermostichus vulcanus]|uniref:Tetratricopeptide repeat protein n=1 Tax=Thermostichus vulcanus str. 'Rupite' TaxID=2813851 RepID=A0ABT0CDS1_THEVL|nr:tetratricopeptide repeat protein [Thermostichus vulcanus]MCJ2543934.1 tetratricopeptide repeat protein [Thermostichus vulcanus str. 'Rupite']